MRDEIGPCKKTWWPIRAWILFMSNLGQTNRNKSGRMKLYWWSYYLKFYFSPPRMSHIESASEDGLGPLRIQNPIPKLLPYCELNVIKASITLI